MGGRPGAGGGGVVGEGGGGVVGVGRRLPQPHCSSSARNGHFRRTVQSNFAENQSYTVNLFFMTINHICIYKR